MTVYIDTINLNMEIVKFSVFSYGGGITENSCLYPTGFFIF